MCFAVVVGRKASKDGAVLFGHNEQNLGDRLVHYRRIERRKAIPGELIKLHSGGSIPQVSETWSYLWTESPGLEFSDNYFNEWGVAVACNGCPTREDSLEQVTARGALEQGGIGYLLPRLVAERATTARQGAQIAGELLSKYGYTGSGRTMTIADPNEAWVMSIARGRQWIAQAQALVSGQRAPLPPMEPLPFAVQPTHAYGVDDVTRILRSHLTGTQFDLAGANSAGCPHEEEAKIDTSFARCVCNIATQESVVWQLRNNLPTPIGCLAWRATSVPCLSVYTPWYSCASNLPAVYHDNEPTNKVLSLKRHFEPEPRALKPTPKHVFWAFERLVKLANGDYQRLAPIIRTKWDEFERQQLLWQSEIEQLALCLHANDQNLAEQFLSEYSFGRALLAWQQAREWLKYLSHEDELPCH